MGKAIKIKRWQKVVCGLIGLLLAYGLASRAIDTGSWWEYLGTLILLIISIRLLVQALKSSYGKK